MKIIYVFMASFFLSGCYVKLNTDDLTAILGKCEKNEGLREVFLYEDSEEATIYCNNGARFKVKTEGLLGGVE